MTTLPSTKRTAFIHVGTHKTGTTSIQSMLALNQAAFLDAGLFVPQTGRIDPDSAGHHNIAWELTASRHFDSRFGTFDALLKEVANANPSTFCLTSEDFEFVHHDNAMMRRLREGILSIGYEPAIIIYLRPQADYLESLYAEMSQGWNVDFTTFFDALSTRGRFAECEFDYERLVSAFSRTFGRDQMIVRPYLSSAPEHALLHEFATTIAPKVEPLQLTLPARLNRMQTFADVIEARERHLGCEVPHALFAKHRFDPLSLSDIVRLSIRFHASNQRVSRRHNIQIACASLATLTREVLTELFHDRESQYRKRLLRALIDEADEIAA